MYYLRKEPYESIIPEIEKTDGTVIPERKYIVHDRAIYKHKRFSRFYRSSYPDCGDNSLKLYEVKSLKKILQLREEMYEYCGEWFDVYDENGKVDIDVKLK